MDAYYRPLTCTTQPKPDGAFSVAQTSVWFTHAMCHRRGADPVCVAAQDIPEPWLTRLTAPRKDILGLDMSQPHVMGILNVTPDSFSDGGTHNTAPRALACARAMIQAGVSLIDIGGESTRPGAKTVPAEAEIARTEPVIRAIRHDMNIPLSIDTRKSSVAEAAVEAGASLINDVSGFTFDPMLAPFAANNDLPVCVMHARGDPETMHINPHYDDVLLDVFDFLEAQILMLESIGMSRDHILVDPGIGFGKTMDHNLLLLNSLSLFHGLGCPVLLGASRKRFIGDISKVETAAQRMQGSIAVALAAYAQGVQITRVHDVAETIQALSLWTAISKGKH
ncbi:MAG: dihydropteroate synthase [Pelagimonas sp.]|jgi:dihydropteroate synthase|nr:dihydropteroate synthase [Pelagimonas sp.]